MIEADIYKALGDPIRLQMVQKLALESRLTIGVLSQNLGISRQGARKQIQVLVSANVVKLIPSGREIQVELDFKTLSIAQKFIAKMETDWDQRLGSLKNLVEKNQTE